MTPDKPTYTVRDLLQRLTDQRGEAVHLHQGEPPVFEVKRTLHRLEGPRLKAGDTYALLAIHASADELLNFQNDGMASFYHRSPESLVFHFMAFRENGHVRLEIRRLK